ncbi:MAG: tetratricopeptide repeat protein [Candidatus Aminicenantes bacterium]|nr:tetratricopeptide repeat protein [Candidatus Aminicenantes bacterium]
MKTNSLKTITFLTLIILLAAGSAFSQAGRGVGRIGGVVVDLEEKPLEGVKLSLVFSQNVNLKFEVTTNKKGEWSFIGLGTGNWELTAIAAGFMPLTKALYVSQLSVNPKVTVKMQKLTKASGGIVADEATFVLLENGNQAYKESKYDEAMAFYQQFLEKNPNLYQIQVSIADCWREKGDFEKAVEIYNKVLEQSKVDAALGKEMAAKSLAGIGNCYLKQNKLKEAQDFFKQSIENSPKDEILAYNVGEIFFSNQGWDEALKYFDLAAQIRPEWPDPYLKLGYVYLNKADNPKAIENFDKFLKLEPEGERAALARNILNVIKK